MCAPIELILRLNFFLYHLSTKQKEEGEKLMIFFLLNNQTKQIVSMAQAHFFYVIVPNTGLCRQIDGPYSSYCAFVWHT